MHALKSPLFWLVICVVGLGKFVLIPKEQSTAQAGSPMVTVTELKLDEYAQTGKDAFEARCAACHGTSGSGNVGVAPPLIHKIYEPSHHGDASFVRAAKLGVQQHHWPFGNMPAVDGITDDEIVAIINYVRTVQRSNGIN